MSEQVEQVQAWWVWRDWINDEVLAIPESEVTEGLRQAVSRERLVIKNVSAPSRHAAVRQAFPEQFRSDENVEAPAFAPPLRPRPQ